jgi:hypothetical protein
MKNLFYCLFLSACTLFLSGCSTLVWGEFLVPEKASFTSKKVYRKDWSLYPTFGAPSLYECILDDDISYIAYPILLDGSIPLGIGPILFPIVPFWWVKYFDKSNERFDCKKIKIIWKGNLDKAKEIGVYHRYAGNDQEGKQVLIILNKKEIIYTYHFKEKLTKESKLVIKLPGDKISKYIQLNYFDNIIYCPYL